MNILGFISVILVCATVITLAIMGMRTHHQEFLMTLLEQSKNTTPVEYTEVKEDTSEPSKPESETVTQASMDAVIQAANALMGIQPIEEEKPHGAREE